MRCQVNDNPSVGALLWDTDTVNIAVDDGLFNMTLSVSIFTFDGRAL